MPRRQFPFFDELLWCGLNGGSLRLTECDDYALFLSKAGRVFSTACWCRIPEVRL
jgi:hypothetical protein